MCWLTLKPGDALSNEDRVAPRPLTTFQTMVQSVSQSAGSSRTRAGAFGFRGLPTRGGAYPSPPRTRIPNHPRPAWSSAGAVRRQ